MVFALVIHTLLPGPCKILYQQTFSQDVSPDEGITFADIKEFRREQLQDVASQVHSEYQFRRAVTNRSVDEDIQRMSSEDVLPEFELGFIRLPIGQPFGNEKIIVWLGAGNTGFSLVCEKSENRMLAENVLRLLIRFFQEHTRLLQQPAEARLKSDKIALVISRFLPCGNLMFMNHRVVRQLEKEVDSLMKI